MRVLGLNMPLIKPGDELPQMILKAAEQVGGLRDGDIVVIASSALATAQGRLRRLASVRASPRAKQLAKESGLEPEFVELVLREAKEILGATKRALMTLKGGTFRVNAGIDHSNAPPGYVVLMPAKPNRAANEIMRALRQQSNALVAVIVADSHIQPLRLGTIGMAVGVAGMEPVIDCRDQLDLFGKPLRITFRAVADQLASAAQVLMGEGAERVPVVVIRDVGVALVDAPKVSPKIAPKRCVYIGSLKLLKLFKRR
ncbi:MAG: coenzyme F420-0:L-glutamate ligase [Candidatus Hodarchaeaceae archaeon]|nr:coenzyme F420-0:L-glutamate ligase [Candidatus Hodarchaeaceae archaeon]